MSKRKIIWENVLQCNVCWFWRQDSGCAWSWLHTLCNCGYKSKWLEHTALANWPSEKKRVQRLILMCLVYDRKLTFCHFVLLQTLKTRALSRVQTKGFIFLLLRWIFRTGRRTEFFTNHCHCADPPRLNVSTPVFAYSARLGFLVSNIARCLFLKAAQTARHSSLFWQILTVFKGVIYF